MILLAAFPVPPSIVSVLSADSPGMLLRITCSSYVPAATVIVTAPSSPQLLRAAAASVKFLKFVTPLPEASIVKAPLSGVHTAVIIVSFAGLASVVTAFGEVAQSFSENAAADEILNGVESGTSAK